MRKPQDFDAELKALEDKARELKTRKVQQPGELVISTGADALTADELAGALIAIAETKDAGKREAWAKRGTAFFRGRSRRSAPAPDRAIIYGALIWMADKLKSDDREKAHALWADKGKQAFDAECKGENLTVSREQHDRV